MGKRKNRRHGFSLLLIGALAMIGSGTAWASTASQPSSADGARPDLVKIDVLKQFGPLERAPVVFRHDSHTRALEKQNKDCLTCHPEKDRQLSLKFKRTEDADKAQDMTIYHDNCIGCHVEMRKAGDKSGPVTCGECHTEEDLPDSNRHPVELDKYLHYRHIRAMDNQCDQCHHEYDEHSKTLVYVKGEEGACVYCHREKTEENRISDREACHLLCIGCHRREAAQKLAAGPIQCGGCHDADNQRLFERPDNTPRLQRNQPDVLLVKQQAAGQPAAQKTEGLGPVAFDHRAHEVYNDTCLVCHHADLGTCVRCHTPDGHPDGDRIKLSQAMHYVDSGASCVGCHAKVQEQARCSGCHHAIMPRTVPTQDACTVCHTALPGDGMVPDDDTAAKALAEQLLARRPVVAVLPALDDIPETVTIRHLSDEYEAVVMPHRQMVTALARRIQDSPLAARFHTSPTTLCQGCHHNAPGTIKPSPCIDCHGRSSDSLNPNRPGLLAAYHQQCIDCHEYMGIQKPASRQCTACHAQRNPQRAAR